MKIKSFIPYIVLVAFAFAFTAPAVAQKNSKSEKYALRDLKSKAIKEARKEAKKYKKQGYGPMPGGIPTAMQLEKVWVKQLEENEDGKLKYMIADGNGVAGTVSAAQMQAMELAKLDLAGQMESNMMAIIETKVANDQIDRETANTLTKVVAGGKNYIAETLTGVRPAFKLMREVGRSNVEVTLKVIYNLEEAEELSRKAAKKAAREELEDESDELLDEIDNLFDNVRSGK